jgi:transcriptional regulator with XRE-family HTH domain
MVETAPSMARREPQTIGDRLLEMLVERGWSLASFSRRSGVSVSQLSMLTRNVIVAPKVSTMQRIEAALGVTERALTGPIRYDGGGRAQDLRAYDGTALVPIVEARPSDDGLEFVETGDTVAIATALMADRKRLLGTLVTGGGMGPHVLIGDRVVFDPDEEVRDGQMVVLLHGGSTIAAWYIHKDKVASYRLSDGSWLPGSSARLIGSIVYIMRTPPSYRSL